MRRHSPKKRTPAAPRPSEGFPRKISLLELAVKGAAEKLLGFFPVLLPNVSLPNPSSPPVSPDRIGQGGATSVYSVSGDVWRAVRFN
jgi:hypothetical protein